MPNRREPGPPPSTPPPAADSTALMERPDFSDDGDGDGDHGPGGFSDEDFTSKVPFGQVNTQPPRSDERTGRFTMTDVGDAESLPSAHVSELHDLGEFDGLDDLEDLHGDDESAHAPTAIMRITPDMLRHAADGDDVDDVGDFSASTNSEIEGEIEMMRWSAGQGASPAGASPPRPPAPSPVGALEINDPSRRASGQAVTQIAVPLPPVPALRAEQISKAPPPGARLALLDEAEAALHAAHNASEATAARFYMQRALQVLARLREHLD